MEIWKKIIGFERYSVSNYGNIRNDERGSFVKPLLSTSGYYYVHLVRDRKKHTKYVHRLVGQAFLLNPNNYPQIDHIDGNKLNDSTDNLRWVSVSQNLLAYGREQRIKTKQKKVKAVHNDGSEIFFESRSSAADHFKCSDTKIRYNYLYTRGNKKNWTFFLV